MKVLKTFGMLLIVVAVFSGAMFALNLYTGPLIEANSAGAANERLDAVMPDGNKSYEDITATLTLPEQLVSIENAKRTAKIVAVHKEQGGLGYVVEVDWTSEDSHGNEPNRVLVGISTDGKIIKVNNEAYHDTDSYNIFNKDPNYPAAFVGKDSALAGVETVSGSTHSSTAFRSAVAHAFDVLILNDLVTAGVKSDAQILEELIPAVTTGYGKLAEVEVSGNIQKALKAENEVGFAYIMTEGEASYLAVVNAMGVCKIYNVEGADVTADHAALATEAKAHAAGKQTAFGDKLSTKLAEMMSGAADITLLELESFNTVAVAASFTVEGTTYYGFYSRSIGWDSRIMNIFVIIDENGAIAKTTMTEFVFEEHDFVEYGGFAGVPGNYLESFVGITQGSDTPVIAGATMSSNAIKQSTTDAFAAFKTINKGGEQ
jgi:Na+-translocating ferredoxin:NAD+ oxidoreductase RnfG subunit